ncbi:AMP-binding protein [Alphaproteobacteria bacterium]|nr:AMP-binding protein [Alphaproteobacteria bacterium]
MPKANLYNYLSKFIDINRDKDLFILPNEKNISYDSFGIAINKIHKNLLNRFIKPGDKVLVQNEKSPLVIALWLACLKLGAIYIPLNSAYTEEELKFFISDSKPNLIVSDKIKKNDIKKISSKKIELLNLNKNISDPYKRNSEKKEINKSYESNIDDTAAILYTSGTTGKPKGAKLSHKNLYTNAKTLLGIWKFDSKDTLLHALPIYHVHGLFVAIHCVLMSGSSMIFLPKFEPKEVINYLPSATVMMGVPTFYSRLLNQKKLDKQITINVRLFISGSAPLQTETWKKFKKITNHEILERYGMSETGMITSNNYLGKRYPGSVGYVLPGIKIKIKNLNKKNIGELYVKGPNVFNGYLNNDEKTKKEFSTDGYFKTGDLVSKSKDGLITIIGRSKDLIISGGLNIYPKEIENLLNKYPGIEESVVVGIPDSDFGEKVVALVKFEKNLIKIEKDKIYKYLNKKIANFKKPKEIIIVNEIPKNSMGKVQKFLIRKKIIKKIII